MALVRIVHRTWTLVLRLLTVCLVVVGSAGFPMANAHIASAYVEPHQVAAQTYQFKTSFHVPVPADAKQHGWCYDTAIIDPETDVYYLADDANKQITVIDPQTGHIHGIGTGLFTGIGNCHTGDYSLDGPNGLALAGNQLFAGNGNSHVLVFNKWTGRLMGDVFTRGTRRADEMAIGGGHLVVANPDEKPHPYLSFIDLRTHQVDQQFAFNDATGGLEQPQFYHGRLFIAVPTTTQSPEGGEVDELDVHTLTHIRIIRTFTFTTCQPAGLAVRNDGVAAVGCANGPAQEILNLNTGQQTAVNGAAGADIVDVHGGDFFYASYGMPALVIADQRGTILQTFPAASAATHTVTVDRDGTVWVPQDKGDVNVYAPLQSLHHCHSIQLPVALTPGGTKQSTIFATFCQPQRDTSSTVLITYHGNSYAQYYWDFPYQPERYSFVRAMQEQGYAVLNLDRLAVDHAYTAPNPAQTPSAEVSMATDNFALHQVVQALRNGKFGTTYARVILVGHSLGGYLAWQAGKEYPADFDGFIITGSTHPLSASATNKVIPLLVPAAQNLKFAQAGLDAGYFAYKAGTRSFYYYLPNADQKVIDLDNQLMQVTVKQELIDGIALESTGVSRSLHVPVLVVLGQYDLFACEPDAITTCTDQTVSQAESPFYAPQACLQVKVIPNSGHDLNLQKNARVWYAAAGAWVDAFVVHHHHACGTRSAMQEGARDTAL